MLDEERHSSTAMQPFVPDMMRSDPLAAVRAAGGTVMVAETLDELCHCLADHGVPPLVALDTIRQFDSAAERGVSDGLPVPRARGLHTCRKAPFFAIPVVPGVTFTEGGIRINAEAQALDRDGRPVPGLFVAGVDVGAISNTGYAGALSAAMITGLRAGLHAARWDLTMSVPPQAGTSPVEAREDPPVEGPSLRAQQYRWRILGSALLIQVTISIVTQGFPALAPFAKGDLELTRPEIGIFATILNLGTMLALLPAGWAVDVLGERRVLVAGGIAAGLVTAVTALAPNFAVFLPLLIIIGLAGATPTPAGSTAIISAFHLRDRAFVMSIRQAGVPLGGALAALILPPIAIAAGWRQALFVAAGLAILGALVGYALVRGAPRKPRGRIRRDRGSFKAVATHDATFIGLAAIFLTLGQFVLVSYIALYLFETWHMSLAEASWFLVAANAGGVAGRLFWGTISDRLFRGTAARSPHPGQPARSLGFRDPGLDPGIDTGGPAARDRFRPRSDDHRLERCVHHAAFRDSTS